MRFDIVARHHAASFPSLSFALCDRQPADANLANLHKGVPHQFLLTTASRLSTLNISFRHTNDRQLKRLSIDCLLELFFSMSPLKNLSQTCLEFNSEHALGSILPATGLPLTRPYGTRQPTCVAFRKDVSIKDHPLRPVFSLHPISSLLSFYSKCEPLSLPSLSSLWHSVLLIGVPSSHV